MSGPLRAGGDFEPGGLLASTDGGVAISAEPAPLRRFLMILTPCPSPLSTFLRSPRAANSRAHPAAALLAGRTGRLLAPEVGLELWLADAEGLDYERCPYPLLANAAECGAGGQTRRRTRLMQTQASGPTWSTSSSNSELSRRCPNAQGRERPPGRACPTPNAGCPRSCRPPPCGVRRLYRVGPVFSANTSSAASTSARSALVMLPSVWRRRSSGPVRRKLLEAGERMTSSVAVNQPELPDDTDGFRT